jgi:CBS domain-containing protein
VTGGTSINDPARSLGRRERKEGEWPPFDSRIDAVERPGHRQAEEPPAFVVGTIMTRNVRSCRPEDTLAAAAVAMCEADCRFLPVVDAAGRPIGVVTDGDICLLGSTSRRPLGDMSVREAMSGPPAACHPEDSILDALRVMRERRIRHLPVVGSEGLLEGVVSLTDLMLCAEEQGSGLLRQELAAALREIVQKRGGERVIEHNPFVED